MQTSFAFRAPTRIDFGGGWTDVPPYAVEQGGFVCNVAISRYATVRVACAPEADRDAELLVNGDGNVAVLRAAVRKYDFRGAILSVTSDFPAAAGLGGSSAAGVAAMAAAARWRGQTLSRADIAEASRDLEITEMGIAGGRQDHYAAAYGGALGIRFEDRVTATPIHMSNETIADLPRRCIVVYTGESRISGKTITAVMGAYRDNNPMVRTALRRMKELAEEMMPALSSGNFDRLGELVREQWQHQRSLDPAIPTALIDKMIATAMDEGAVGCKALGASGGGCVLMIAGAGRADHIRRAVATMGQEIAYSVDTSGVTEVVR